MRLYEIAFSTPDFLKSIQLRVIMLLLHQTDSLVSRGKVTSCLESRCLRFLLSALSTPARCQPEYTPEHCLEGSPAALKESSQGEEAGTEKEEMIDKEGRVQAHLRLHRRRTPETEEREAGQEAGPLPHNHLLVTTQILLALHKLSVSRWELLRRWCICKKTWFEGFSHLPAPLATRGTALGR